MDIKKRMKRFFTLSRSAEGFTLVELIVVIAILAILAGIALPGYGQYVEASKRATERNQMALYHNAFVVACVSENATATGVTLKDGMDETGGVFNGLATVTADVDEEAKAAIVSLFNSMFEPYTFEYHGASAVIDAILDGVQEEAGGEEDDDGTPNPYAGLPWDYEALRLLQGSTFMTADGLGVDNLLGQIDDITQMAMAFGNETAAMYMNNILNSPGFLATAMKAVGATTQEEFLAKRDELAEQMVADAAAKGETLSMPDARMKVSTNAAVLYASQTASKMDINEVTALLTNGAGYETYESIKGEMGATATTGDGFAHASLAYGMYLSWAHYTNNSDAKENATDPLDAMFAYRDMTDDERDSFNDYLTSTDGQNDLQAYMAALGMIASSGDGNHKDEVDEVLVNGFTDGNLNTAIKDAMEDAKNGAQNEGN